MHQEPTTGTIPIGLCQCGCGGRTPIAIRSTTCRGYVKGEYHRFLKGHKPTVPTNDRFWAKVDKDGPNGCWVWRGSLVARGYGTFWDGSEQVRAHRFSYELLVGPIPTGLTIDHLCRNKACVNPDHLEPCPRGENTLRGDTITARNLLKTHCPSGHEYSVENTLVRRTGARACRACARERARRTRRARRKAA